MTAPPPGPAPLWPPPARVAVPARYLLILPAPLAAARGTAAVAASQAGAALAPPRPEVTPSSRARCHGNSAAASWRGGGAASARALDPKIPNGSQKGPGDRPGRPWSPGAAGLGRSPETERETPPPPWAAAQCSATLSVNRLFLTFRWNLWFGLVYGYCITGRSLALTLEIFRCIGEIASCWTIYQV